MKKILFLLLVTYSAQASDMTQDDYNKLAQNFFRENYLPVYINNSSTKAIQNSPLKLKLDEWIKEVSALPAAEIQRIAASLYYYIKAIKRGNSAYNLPSGLTGSSDSLKQLRTLAGEASKGFDSEVRRIQNLPEAQQMTGRSNLDRGPLASNAYWRYIALPIYRYFYSALFTKFVKGKKIKYAIDGEKSFPSPSLIK